MFDLECFFFGEQRAKGVCKVFICSGAFAMEFDLGGEVGLGGSCSHAC